MIAVVKLDAQSIFWRGIIRQFSREAPIPQSYHDFYDLLGKLKGKSFVVDRMYDERIVLKYPKSMIKGNVVAVDMEKSLVDIKGDS